MLRIRVEFCIGLALVALSTASGGPARADLLVNGSFEQGNFVNSGDGFQNLPVGSTAITGWSVINNAIAWGYVVNNYGVEPSDGQYFLDLTGYHQYGLNAGVAQSIATTVGQQYRLSFDLGADLDNPVYSGPFDVTASAGGTSETITYNPSGSGNVWTRYSLDFTADSGSTLISLTGSGGNSYIGLDNVSVEVLAAAVPEPSSLSIAGGVSLLIGGMFPKRRRDRRIE